MNEIRLLLVEDDTAFSQIVKDSLELTGDYIVYTAKDGQEGYSAFKSLVPEVIVSDVEMPKMSGLEMVKLIRKEDENIPILLASAHTGAKDLSDGFKLNVDNYIKKPYLAGELNWHIKAIMRRVHQVQEEAEKIENTVFTLGRYLLDLKNCVLVLDEERFDLTIREAEILQMLYENKGIVVKRKDILLHFWGTDNFYTSRSLDVFVSKLRKYLKKDPSIQIQTIRGEGLRLIL
ncbi:MAG: response regulator transcription factor [Tannerella sp.]|jgi:DNA-binding response OmpR family regulator|nr:response regulator transcription factor [Tannerella sp.]